MGTTLGGCVMFVRWKRRPVGGVTRHSRPETLISAVLVKSERTSGGQVRQRIMRYLGSIREERIKYPSQRGFFWEKATAALGGLEPADRRRIERELRARVSRPTARDFKRQEAESRKRIERIVRALKT